MRSAIHVREIEMEYIVLLLSGFAERMHAFRAQMGIELLLVRIESRRKPDQGCGKQASEKDCGDHCQRMSGDSCSHNKPTRLFGTTSISPKRFAPVRSEATLLLHGGFV